MEQVSSKKSDTEFEKSSMSVVELNNYIVSLRGTVRKAKLHIIQKLVKQIKQYRNKKGTEEQKASNCKKAERLLQELAVLKKVKLDRISKFSLGNLLTTDQAAAQGNLEEKVCARVACSKLVAANINKWRQEHGDWEALAAFALSKNTGRRFKKNKQSSLTSLHSTSDRTCSIKKADENPTKVLLKPSVKTSNVAAIKDESDVSAVQSKKTSVESNADSDSGLSAGVTDTFLKVQLLHREIVVKQISLDELSDEELFLPEPVEERLDSERMFTQSAPGKVENSFFVCDSDTEEIESSATNQNTKQQTTEEEDEDEINQTRCVEFVKESAKFTKSLSHSSRKMPHSKSRASSAGNTKSSHFLHADRKSGNRRQKQTTGKYSKHSKFSAKEFTKTQSRYPKVQNRSQNAKQKNQLQEKRQQFGRNRNRKMPVSNNGATWRQPVESNQPHSKVQRHAKTNPVDTKSDKSSKDNKLHPSWEASKQRRHQEKNIFVFQGSRKTFNDDD